MLMSSVELRSERARQSDGSDVPPDVASNRDNFRSRIPVAPILITLATIAVAALLAYVVTMAPEVAGRIVKLPVADNQFVHKGDMLFEIEPADYRIALESAQAQLQRDGAALDYARAHENRKASLAKEGWTSTDIYQQTTSTLHQSEGLAALDKAAVAKAQLDLSRTVIRSPVSGYVTNLLAQLGDYATVGQKLISVVDTDSFWVDGYFEETGL